jgi:hypothetical protein
MAIKLPGAHGETTSLRWLPSRLLGLLHFPKESCQWRVLEKHGLKEVHVARVKFLLEFSENEELFHSHLTRTGERLGYFGKGDVSNEARHHVVVHFVVVVHEINNTDRQYQKPKTRVSPVVLMYAPGLMKNMRATCPHTPRTLLAPRQVLRSSDRGTPQTRSVGLRQSTLQTGGTRCRIGDTGLSK